MSVVNLSTECLRHVLRDIQTKGWDYRPCAAYDVIGPAGAPYITANTLLNFQHLKWFERRNPVPEEPTYIEVVFYHKDHLPTAGVPSPACWPPWVLPTWPPSIWTNADRKPRQQPAV